MKALDQHVIVFDDECPLCKVYTSAFVKTGMLGDGGRQPYSEMATQKIKNMDWDRARNEIALINQKDNTIIYGIDSLVKILGNNWAFITKLLKCKPLHFALTQLYFFISFNRKVIAPGKIFGGDNRCTPDMHLGYRWAYIIFSWLVTSWVLTHYASLVIPLVPASSYSREFLICGGQILFQGLIVGLIRRDRCIHYLGNMMTVSLVGAILLIPGFLLSHPLVPLSYFLIVVSMMLLEHAHRVEVLELPWYVSGTWVLYRLLILFIIYL